MSVRLPVLSGEYRQPRTRGECVEGGTNVERPCPWVSCRYHLYLNVNEETGRIKENFPGLESWEIPMSCALDVADGEELKLSEIAKLLNVDESRIRQIEKSALSKLKVRGEHLK